MDRPAQHPPDYTKMDESHGSDLLPDPPGWPAYSTSSYFEASDGDMRELPQHPSHLGSGNGDQQYYARDFSFHRRTDSAATNDQQSHRYTDLFTNQLDPRDSASMLAATLTAATATAATATYIEQYERPAPAHTHPHITATTAAAAAVARPGLHSALPRQYLVDDGDGAGDEMELPPLSGGSSRYRAGRRSLSKDEKYRMSTFTLTDQEFYDEQLDNYRKHEPHRIDEEMSDDSEADDNNEDDEEEEEEEENSPIEIVAATVSTFDDPNLPCLTFRFWVIGTFFTVLGAGISQLFYFRANAIIFSVFFVQLMSYPIGILMAIALPRRQFCWFGQRFSLNPGPFNMKEHMLIGVSANTGGTAAYAVDILAVQRIFYDQDIGPVGSILLLLTTQCIGYGMAGFLRRFLVTPANMIWPSNLVQVALYNTLHSAEPKHSGMRRQTFFVLVFAATFLYQLLPFYMAPILSSMAILCWILPHNGVAQLLGSGMQGLGIMTVSLDWAAVGSFGPLYTPWWAQLNFFVGCVLTLWVLAPTLYFTNLWQAQRFDLVSSTQYDEDGGHFDMNRLLNADFQLDPAKLASYSGLRMSPLFAFTYGTAFLTLTATLMHVFLYYRHSIIRQFRASRAEKEDIHTRMMRTYPPVPISWYAGLFVTMLVAAMITCELYPIRLPWWALLLAILVAISLTLPIGIIQAISNNRIGLNVITELICGYLYPGHPIPNVAFKVYGYMTMFQCLLLVEDMKLGHYMKVPPRKLFLVQLWGTVVGALVNYGVLEWVLAGRLAVLRGRERDPTGQWDARNTKIFYAASIIWGALGPARTFGNGSPYAVLLWFFLVGALLPVPFYLLHKRYPNGKWHLVNIPIFAIGTYAVPQSPANFIVSGFLVSFVFQFLLYRRQHSWWKRYNYVLSAALDAGTQFCMLFVFVTLSGTPFPSWLGNRAPNTELCNLKLLASKRPAPLSLSFPTVGDNPNIN